LDYSGEYLCYLKTVRIDDESVPRSKLTNRRFVSETIGLDTEWLVLPSSLKFNPSLVQKLLVRVGAIDTDPSTTAPFFWLLRLIPLEVVRFYRAAAAEIPGVEVKNYPLAR